MNLYEAFTNNLKEYDNDTYSVQLWQITDVGNTPYAFMGWSERTSKDFNWNDYEFVTVYEVKASKDMDALNKVYERGNLDQDRQHRSISVSDVLILNKCYYYVDSFGFKDITNEMSSTLKEAESTDYYENAIKELKTVKTASDLRAVMDQVLSAEDVGKYSDYVMELTSENGEDVLAARDDLIRALERDIKSSQDSDDDYDPEPYLQELRDGYNYTLKPIQDAVVSTFKCDAKPSKDLGWVYFSNFPEVDFRVTLRNSLGNIYAGLDGKLDWTIHSPEDLVSHIQKEIDMRTKDEDIIGKAKSSTQIVFKFLNTLSKLNVASHQGGDTAKSVVFIEKDKQIVYIRTYTRVPGNTDGIIGLTIYGSKRGEELANRMSSRIIDEYALEEYKFNDIYSGHLYKYSDIPSICNIVAEEYNKGDE